MSEPFFRSARKLNTIGLIIAILAMIIFVVSCLLNVYAYTTTPTATPTASATPTTTNTPRPSHTPTSTPTLTETPTPEMPTATEAPASIFSHEPFSALERTLIEHNYECIAQDLPESDQVSTICTQLIDNLSIQLIFTSEVEDNIQAQFIAAPFDLEKIDLISEEFIWLAQMTSMHLWIEPVIQTATPETTQTSLTPVPAELDQWIDDMIHEISAGDIVQTAISGLEIELSLIDTQLRLLLLQPETDIDN